MCLFWRRCSFYEAYGVPRPHTPSGASYILLIVGGFEISYRDKNRFTGKHDGRPSGDTLSADAQLGFHLFRGIAHAYISQENGKT